MAEGADGRESDAQKFGLAVRGTRTQHGWTQEWLAEAALGNADRKGYVSRVEKGLIPNITRETVRKLATALGIDRRSVPTSLQWPPADSSERHPVDKPGLAETEVAHPQYDAWNRYKSNLSAEFRKNIPGSKIPLSQLYTPLRVTYSEVWSRLSSAQKSQLKSNYDSTPQRVFKIIADAADVVSRWLAAQTESSDAIRVLRGGPGSGKSTFAKFVTHSLIEAKAPFDDLEIREILFIPLQRFEDSEPSLEQSIDKFIRENVVENGSLAGLINSGPGKSLLVFDGLDELSIESFSSSETSLRFMRKLTKLLDKYNHDNLSILGLLIGRDLALHNVENELSLAQHQVLKLLPYVISDTSAINTSRDGGLDQRVGWWRRWLRAHNEPQRPLPDRLLTGPLFELSREPLLLQLVCSTGAHEASAPALSNRNALYEFMISRVITNWHNRSPSENTEFKANTETIGRLEVMAASAWITGGRGTSGGQLREVASIFRADMIDSGVLTQDRGYAQALLSFYLEPFGTFDDIGFEFTHKSFSDYLTARLIFRYIASISDVDGDARGISVEELATFLSRGEMSVDLANILASFAMAGSDDERTAVDSTWTALARQIGGGVGTSNTRFRELFGALTIARGAAAMGSKRLTRLGSVPAHSARTIIDLISSQGKVVEWEWRHEFTSFIPKASPAWLMYLNNVDFSGQNLDAVALRSANLFRSGFRQCEMRGAQLVDCILTEADFSAASLQGTSFPGCNLHSADFSGADLRGADFSWANGVRRGQLDRAKIDRSTRLPRWLK
ncbi:MAG TPA: pentapeptide repeat-containing protein [Allosphingosinicella sp.]